MKAALAKADPNFDRSFTGTAQVAQDQLEQVDQRLRSRILDNAMQLVDENWSAIERTAELLQQHQIISGDEVDAAITRATSR